MKSLHYAALLLVGLLTFSACLKNEGDSFNTNQPEIDRQIIVDYIAENNLNMQEHETGIFFTIDEEGQGEHPTLESTVEVKYKGWLTDGFVFDETTGDDTIEFKLSGLIPGWQVAIPMLKPGGKGTFLIPSAWAYGTRQVGPIPPNSVLIFDIELVGFK